MRKLWPATVKVMDRASAILVLFAVVIGATRLVGRTLDRGHRPGDQVLEPATFARIVAGGQWLGPQPAAVVILVYSDYACGFCAELHETLQALMRRYPQHLAVVIKHFVSPSYSRRFHVPLGSECAAEQGRFREYHNAAFASSRVMKYADGARLLADSAGVPDSKAFEACVHGSRYAGKIAQQYEEARALGVTLTPTIFVNGHVVVGAAPIEALDSLIAAEFPDRNRRD